MVQKHKCINRTEAEMLDCINRSLICQWELHIIANTYLPHDDAFRRNKVAFLKNRIERDEPPPRLSGEQVWEKVYGISKITDSGKCVVSGRGVFHNWTKRSIFWDLPYWRHNLLRHNLDVMHIEKNVFDNVFHTVMDNKEKTKDNTNMIASWLCF